MCSVVVLVNGRLQSEYALIALFFLMGGGFWFSVGMRLGAFCKPGTHFAFSSVLGFDMREKA